MKNYYLSLCLLFITFSISPIYSGDKIYSSYKGLIMAGYQGWFNTPNDGAERGWYHYKGKKGFKPGSCSIDLWPDVSEYEQLYKTEFKLSNGSNAYVFSSYDESTVNTHFRWMKEYGIDGVFMQRFITEIKSKSGLHHFNTVLSHAMKSAQEYSRAICIMYDLSGMKPGDEYVLLNDIKNIMNKYSIKDHDKNSSYLYHNNKPLIAVWGVGFNDNRKYGLKECEFIIDKLKENGFSVMLGVPTGWRELTGDTQNSNRLHTMIKKCDIIMPWFVGRYSEETYNNFKTNIEKDIEWSKLNGIDYVPLVFPGFSWKNLKGNEGIQIPRNKGQFFWKQLSSVIELGAQMIYVAMFDEIDEGTAIFKCAKDVPVGESKFVPIEKDIPNDYYLWLVGKAGKMLRKEIKYSKNIPMK